MCLWCCVPIEIVFGRVLHSLISPQLPMKDEHLIPKVSNTLGLQNLPCGIGGGTALKHEGIEHAFRIHPAPQQMTPVLFIESHRFLDGGFTLTILERVVGKVVHFHLLRFGIGIESLALPFHPDRHQSRKPSNGVRPPLRNHQTHTLIPTFQHSPRYRILHRIRIHLGPMIRMPHILHYEQCYTHFTLRILPQFPCVLYRPLLFIQFSRGVHGIVRFFAFSYLVQDG
mmetsp:Transcript_42193/g.49300  ORF Transcript_42193/g.49300 Transcript_42193/m.49300 type:complete len:227 (-) Transcript_42193:593-1273(-)